METMKAGFLCLIAFMLVLGTDAQLRSFRGGGGRGPKRATCVLAGEGVSGLITLTQENPSSAVRLTGQISGLSAGSHGFHVHEFGDLSEGCVSAGGHYNPFGKQHGAPGDEDRHVGDLGNIVADNRGTAQIEIVDRQLRLCGPLSIMGRAIVVHQREDDLGRGGDEESRKTGNAGPRVGCCVIGVARNP